MTRSLALFTSLLLAQPVLANSLPEPATPAPIPVALSTEPVEKAEKPAHAAHWSYEGATGPEHWADLDSAAAVCALGAEQSPINLTRAIAAEAEPVQLFWNKTADWVVENNGHTVQASTANGGMMTVDGKDFLLKQFHFHIPSEHAIDGRRAAMEVHFVHKSEDGALAVLGVMLEEGGENDLFSAVMARAPQAEGKAEIGPRNPLDLLPTEAGFFRYQGSLTTPPCAETVLWTVLKQPIKVGRAQIEAFSAMFSMNARPLQEARRRFVLEN